MTATSYRIFIADLHLSCNQSAKWQYLIRWLDSLRYPVEELYILGDLFKYWLGDDYQDEMTRQLQAAFGRLSQRMEIVLLRGNRDYLLGHGFTGDSVQLRADGCPEDLYGRSTLLLHGDCLCRRDWRYRWFRAAVDNRVSRWLFTAMPLGWRDRIAQLAQDGLPHKSAEDIWLDYRWLEQQLLSKQAQQVIYGHLHQACLYEREGYREISLPSWDFNPNWLRYYNDHSVQFVTAPDMRSTSEAAGILQEVRS